MPDGYPGLRHAHMNTSRVTSDFRATKGEEQEDNLPGISLLQVELKSTWRCL